MPQLNVVRRDGSQQSIDGQTGLSVMEIIRDAGFDELLAYVAAAVRARRVTCALTQPLLTNCPK